MKKILLKLAAVCSAAGFLCAAGLLGAGDCAPAGPVTARADFREGTFALATPNEHAASLGAYDFTIESYETEMNVSKNRVVAVKEVISVYFSGYDSHGIIRDFPLDSGVRYKHIQAICNIKDFSPYIKNDDLSFLSLYLRGSEPVKGQRRQYTLTYQMELPALGDGYLPLDVLGFGWQARIQSFSASVTVPDGLEEYAVYSGARSSKSDSVGVNRDVRMQKYFVLSAQNLGFEEGITLDLQFGSGVLESNFDFSILYALFIGAALSAVALLLKLLFCKQPVLTETVNLEAPEEMDPLLMGKLIDNKVDNEDLGALVFYLADKGCLTIDLENRDDPELRVTGKSLPKGTAGHVRTFYDGLFANRESVRMSGLNNKFYMTAQSVKAGAELAAGELYRRRSIVLIVVFGILCTIFTGGFLLLYNLLNVYGDYFYWLGIPVCALSFSIAAAGNAIAVQRGKKLKKGIGILLSVGFCLLGLLPVLLFSLFPCAGVSVFTGLTLALFSALSGGIAGRFITRTEEYNRKLGQILGFKRFILFTEKDRIERMLKDEPALFYHILPYAQVLGVTDAWTDKFQGLDMQPPAYAHGAAFQMDVFNVILMSNLFRSMNATMIRSFVSRPSSSGGGFHGGSFGGGFGGGGFGGGGGRGC